MKALIHLLAKDDDERRSVSQLRSPRRSKSKRAAMLSSIAADQPSVYSDRSSWASEDSLLRESTAR